MIILERNGVEPRVMIYLLGALVDLVVSDNLISQFLVGHGLGQKANPFPETLVGGWNFLVIKVLGVFVCTVYLCDLCTRRSKQAMILTMCFIVLYSVIVLWTLFIFIVTKA